MTADPRVTLAHFKSITMAVDIKSAGHYQWGKGCDGWHFLKSDSLSVIRERMPSNTSEQLHYHERAQQFFYVIAGEATFEVDGELTTVVADQGLHISAGTKHRISNLGKVDLEFLVISEPKSHGDRINLKDNKS